MTSTRSVEAQTWRTSPRRQRIQAPCCGPPLQPVCWIVVKPSKRTSPCNQRLRRRARSSLGMTLPSKKTSRCFSARRRPVHEATRKSSCPFSNKYSWTEVLTRLRRRWTLANALTEHIFLSRASNRLIKRICDRRRQEVVDEEESA